ncbi:hypothetical protein FN846DRAFT_921673 [Sphaerosporella brunnea]|uniref:Uncharacterized protein n=1 Tax=Sphaerosporella brunnea TaxID=1250544 RepID=A0A5J5EMU7_9PEZI|nr:hypothetical protein FN846DRAFT_921673 [Sphaerosporella brunnea]
MEPGFPHPMTERSIIAIRESSEPKITSARIIAQFESSVFAAKMLEAALRCDLDAFEVRLKEAVVYVTTASLALLVGPHNRNQSWKSGPAGNTKRGSQPAGNTDDKWGSQPAGSPYGAGNTKRGSQPAGNTDDKRGSQPAGNTDDKWGSQPAGNTDDNQLAVLMAPLANALLHSSAVVLLDLSFSHNVTSDKDVAEQLMSRMAGEHAGLDFGEPSFATMIAYMGFLQVTKDVTNDAVQLHAMALTEHVFGRFKTPMKHRLPRKRKTHRYFHE